MADSLSDWARLGGVSYLILAFFCFYKVKTTHCRRRNNFIASLLQHTCNIHSKKVTKIRTSRFVSLLRTVKSEFLRSDVHMNVVKMYRERSIPHT